MTKKYLSTNLADDGREIKEFKLSDKIDAIFEMLHLLDEKVTTLTNRFNKLIKVLGYNV